MDSNLRGVDCLFTSGFLGYKDLEMSVSAVITTHLVTFSDESMSRSAQLCWDSFVRMGYGIDGHWVVTDGWLMGTQFWKDNRDLLRQPRGLGFWCWKPFLILERLNQLERGVLVYADAGIEFIANTQPIIDRMDQDIFLFGNNWEHAHWCKRDVVEAMWPTFANAPMDRSWNAVADSATWMHFGKQVQASVIFFRVSDYTRKFVKEWLNWCLFEGGRLIDDSPSRLPNHPEFQEHRHDQAILTTMAYREGVRLHWWPAMYNDGAFVYAKLPCYAEDDYPVLFHHHRRRNADWENVA